MPAGPEQSRAGRGSRPAAPDVGPASITRESRRTGDSKRAAQIAVLIVDDVIAQGWPVGKVLGASTEFLERYGISRAVFREAVRLLEHQQVVRARRGPGGGLVVTEPSVDAVIDAVTIYLYRVDARIDAVFEARMVLEEIVADLAPRKLTSARRARIREVIEGERSGQVEDPQALHQVLASATGNPALELFVEMLKRVSTLYMRAPGRVDPTVIAHAYRAHARIADAVLDGDRRRGRDRMRQHLAAELDYFSRRRTTRRMLPSELALGESSGHKRAEQVGRAIFRDIVDARLQPGDLVGSEPELIERYGVGRAVFREAIRLLEHHHIAEMRRGPRGGLFVMPPSTAAVAEVVAIYLARRGVGLRSLAELRVLLEVALTDLTIDRLDEDSAEELDRAAELDEDSETADTSIHNLHATVASLAKNPALELIALVLIRLTRFYQFRELTDEELAEIPRAVRRAHVGIAEAIKAGDHGLARRRMARHLDALWINIDEAAS